MQLVIGEEKCVNTIKNVKLNITELINIIVEHMQKDVQNSSIKLTNE
jgi:hypothetical protein